MVLNGCYSEVQAKAISQHIPYVIGMKQSVGDRAAIEFAVGFYDALGDGRSVEFAFNLGKVAMELGSIGYEEAPIILKGPKLNLDQAQPSSDTQSSKQTNSSELKPKTIDTKREAIKVFFSYAHKDEALRDKLANHLKVMERTGVIESWHDRQVLPGEEWDGQIDDNLATADIILLLVSDDFPCL